MSQLRMKELKDLDKEGLLTRLTEYKKELSQLRVNQSVAGTASKLSKIGTMRKNIARILTVLNQTERANLRKFYAGKKYTPKSLRPKLTKSRRQALKPVERNKKLRRTIRREAKYPKRVYAVKV